MTRKTWAQLSIDYFFEAQTSPTQAECDEVARSLSNATGVRNVDVPGSLSYTVIGTGRPNQSQDLIISSREQQSTIDYAPLN
ncbi:hypothetical protein PISL3812_00700 [Talaromyces islandicus]|uniref:Uncharacterized protein n=1 Tax=Talaromyces islandicus TaxID=28573 RepID=A0A0U1LK04_TALIS|nr:hypothetical protein PISL3812_00700 [Talaromyces islandicus]